MTEKKQTHWWDMGSQLKQQKAMYKDKVDSLTYFTEATGKRLGVPGVGNDDALDAWRHAQTSALLARDGLAGPYFPKTQATIAGTGHEIIAQGKDAIAEPWSKANQILKKPDDKWIIQNQGNAVPIERTLMDQHNNAIGREYGEKARKQGWDDERLEQELLAAYQRGEFITNPTAPVVLGRDGKVRQPIETTLQAREGGGREELKGSYENYPYSGMESPEQEIDAGQSIQAPQSNPFDGIGRGLRSLLDMGKAGAGTLMGLGMETLKQNGLQAVNHGLPQDVKQQALETMGRVVLTQTLGQVSTRMQQVQNQNRPWSDLPGRTPGYFPGIGDEEMDGVLNSPHNQSILSQLARKVGDFAQRKGRDPLEMMVDEVSKLLGTGVFEGIRPVDIGTEAIRYSVEQKKKPDEGRWIEVLGVKLPFAMPEGMEPLIYQPEVIKYRQQPVAEAGGSAAATAGGGDVQVKGYSRGNGSVKSHSRTRPDGEVSNNRSFRK